MLPCVQLVVVSPLMRACETAAAAFGTPCSDTSEASLLMKQQDEIPLERAAHDAVALPPGLRIVAHEFAREQVGESHCHHEQSCNYPRLFHPGYEGSIDRKRLCLLAQTPPQTLKASPSYAETCLPFSKDGLSQDRHPQRGCVPWICLP